ncbi:MAG: DUF4296 domain-containing protein [Bacteroidota bacterium]
MMKIKFFQSNTGYVFILILMMVFSIFSCSEKEKERPEVVLSESEMVEVMVDVHLAEAVLTRKRGENQEVEDLSDKYYDEVFDKHNITKKQFDTSFSYYQQNLSNLQRIYEQVITELNKMQRERELLRKKKQDNTQNDSTNQPDPKTEKRKLKMNLKEKR